MAERRYDWGAEPIGENHWHARIWAPEVSSLALRIQGQDIEMVREKNGWYGLEFEAASGMDYAFVLPNGGTVPDPASRRQSGSVHDASVLTGPRRPSRYCERAWEEAVICELHVGTFTTDGTFRAAVQEFGRLADLGITAVEILPVAQFAGPRGWGYDGVLPYAPHPSYGTPDDLAALVEAAHEAGLIALIDVVYNHFGPEGNHLHAYAESFFDTGRQTPWGPGIDYTRAPVRRFFIDNALYWLGEFGFDGLRLDAIDQITDPSDPELLVEMARELRTRLPDCPVHLTTEDNRNVTHLHEREDGEVVLHTAEWNDDFHNAAHVLATGESDGYYKAFTGDALGLLARALAEGFSFQGEGERGEPSAHLPPAAFIDFLQNHDQTGNRAHGERLISLTDPETLNTLIAIHLLSPHIPLLFMGEEYDETRPFLFFAGFDGDLAHAVRDGRQAEFADFEGFGGRGRTVPNPISPETFEASRLDQARRESAEGRAAMARTKRLLDLRRAYIVPHLAATGGHSGTILSAHDGVLAVDWQLDTARLQLRANFADAPRRMPPVCGGEINRTGELGTPRSAQHWIEIG